VTSVRLDTWKTTLWLSARAKTTPSLHRWLTSLLHDEVAALDRLASRFRADSELSAVNAAAGRWTEVSWDFVTVLSASLNGASATGGLVDPLLGRQLVAAGYDRWAGQDSGVAAADTESDQLAVGHAAAWESIEIRPGGGQARVRIPQRTALDLGAVAKGWLADRVAKIAHTSTGFDVVANMGGDLRVISPGAMWTVAADPDIPGVEPCAMDAHDVGMATSSVGHRAWAGGHHIIDPRTGRPAETCWDSVSVLAAEAAGANAASTASLILGHDGPAWCHGMGLDGWFVSRTSSQPVGAWPVEREHVAARA